MWLLLGQDGVAPSFLAVQTTPSPFTTRRAWGDGVISLDFESGAGVNKFSIALVEAFSVESFISF